MLQIFGEVNFFFVKCFVVGRVDEQDGAFGERVFVVPSPDGEALTIVAERLKHDDTLARTVVKLLARAVAVGRRVGHACRAGGRGCVAGNALSARLHNVPAKPDVDLAFLVDLDKVAPANFDEVFLKFERVHGPIWFGDAQDPDVSRWRGRSESDFSTNLSHNFFNKKRNWIRWYGSWFNFFLFNSKIREHST